MSAGVASRLLPSGLARTQPRTVCCYREAAVVRDGYGALDGSASSPLRGRSSGFLRSGAVDPATRWIKRNNTKILAMALVLGIALQDLAALVSPAVLVLAVTGMLLACLRMRVPPLGAAVGRPGLIAAFLVWALVLAPVLVFAAASLALDADSPLLAGLTLNAAAPSMLSAPAYALIVGVDPVLATVLAVLTTLAAPFSIPALADVLLGAEFAFGGPSLLLRLLAIVVLILGGAWLGKRLLGQDRIERYGDRVDAAVVVCIAAFGIGLMHGVRAVLVEQPVYAIAAIAAAFALNIVLQSAGVLLFWRWGRRTGATTALVSGNRNLAIVLAAIADVAPPDVILYIVCAQFPIFSLPLLMRPAFARLQARTGSAGPTPKRKGPGPTG